MSKFGRDVPNRRLISTQANIWHNLNEMYLPAQRHHLVTRGVAAGERITGVSWLPQFLSLIHI